MVRLDGRECRNAAPCRLVFASYSPPHNACLQGLMEEFREDSAVTGPYVQDREPDPLLNELSWRLVNGLWAVILGLGLLLTSMFVFKVRVGGQTPTGHA